MHVKTIDCLTQRNGVINRVDPLFLQRFRLITHFVNESNSSIKTEILKRTSKILIIARKLVV